MKIIKIIVSLLLLTQWVHADPVHVDPVLAEEDNSCTLGKYWAGNCTAKSRVADVQAIANWLKTQEDVVVLAIDKWNRQLMKDIMEVCPEIKQRLSEINQWVLDNALKWLSSGSALVGPLFYYHWKNTPAKSAYIAQSLSLALTMAMGTLTPVLLDVHSRSLSDLIEAFKDKLTQWVSVDSKDELTQWVSEHSVHAQEDNSCTMSEYIADNCIAKGQVAKEQAIINWLKEEADKGDEIILVIDQLSSEFLDRFLEMNNDIWDRKYQLNIDQVQYYLKIGVGSMFLGGVAVWALNPAVAAVAVAPPNWD